MNEVHQSLFRRTVGQLQRRVHVRPDVAFTFKYLTLFLNAHTEKHFTALKHLWEVVTAHCSTIFYLKPDLKLDPFYQRTSQSLHHMMMQNWAGCVATLKKSPGLVASTVGSLCSSVREDSISLGTIFRIPVSCLMWGVWNFEPWFVKRLVKLVWVSWCGWLVGWKPPDDGSAHAN